MYIKEQLKKYEIIAELNRQINIIYREILKEPLNRNLRLKYLYNYFLWHFIYKKSGKTFEITLQNGFKSIVYPDSDSGVSNIYNQNVDYYENQFIRSVLNKGDFIVDAGCNVGNRTLVLADIIGGALLLDGNSRCFNRLKRNFWLNDIDLSNYNFVKKVVGSEEKKIYFSNYGGTSCLNQIIEKMDRKNHQHYSTVSMTTIDKELIGIGEPTCTFIKYDLEGYDYLGLLGSRNTLMRGYTRLVKFEKWPSVNIERFKNFFKQIDWVLFTLDDKGRPIFDDKKISSSFNLFAKPKNIDF